MQDILTCVMGLDVHRDIIVACLVKGAVDAEPEAETRTFSTLIPEMQKLRDWVIESECRNIAMESTGIYWQPIYEMLESCFDGEISILVVNARHMKNVPGRKTDMKDAQWIATLLRAGLLKGSFIPDKAFRELRHLTRYRKSVVHDITAQKNRIDKPFWRNHHRAGACPGGDRLPGKDALCKVFQLTRIDESVQRGRRHQNGGSAPLAHAGGCVSHHRHQPHGDPAGHGESPLGTSVQGTQRCG